MQDSPYQIIEVRETPNDDTAKEHLVYERVDSETDTTHTFPIGGVKTAEFVDDDDLPERIDFDFFYYVGNENSPYRVGAETWRDDGTVIVLKEPRLSGEPELYNYAGHAAGQEYIWERPFAESRTLKMLLKNGVTGTAALDFLMTTVLDTPRDEWQEEIRDVSQQALSDNLGRAEDNLGPNSEYWTRD